jgi:shikimate dehydrogenase
MQAPISGATRILGLIADPVVQARTPALANAMLRERGLAGGFVLVPMQVHAANLGAFVVGLRQMENFSGAVVSMPHKIAVCELLDDLSADARLVGAVNVVRRHANGRLAGTILDGEGFVAGLGGAGHQVRGARVVLAGAGGAASAIAFALARHGCASICILNRTAQRAQALAQRVAAAFPEVAMATEDKPGAQYEIGVNATSLGMRGSDALPLSKALITRCALLAECVIAPEITPLLAIAGAQSKSVHTGLPMLAAQMDLMLGYMGVV